MRNGKSKIGIVVSTFNTDITEKLLSGAIAELTRSGFEENQVDVVKVPGAVEIPLIAKLLGLKEKYDAIICLGCVIRGDTDHYDYVCQQVSDGCQKVMLELKLPIIFGVLTTQNIRQARARVCDNSSHKGVEVAQAAVQMITLMKSVCMN
ncbi:MAG: 6,7-dimethyl-8-ribityllumazine synthase [Gammaproteobacteria bacterium CG_4_10_14_0_8_um_filter_38_16]|nr:MAG: 6,7-dimethyl-8-ribityllumazine synthase [Gammaproteobacteria bacterium CG_4_10_14_0_8_um_filter_38_16]PJA02736.1 MAG: 6,7-dimethyl-8-ribityllumazine synthase [Gammaproteobacteria bacterium CG_4_10_14_0_2_um_filter_38_22]PJB10867.1 MAG: 6,7-dimethyl-8-ribityllumazine synthase [Gammaproteobacteria bacterium CG_4_9_14_3_um_filter_38_9]